MNLQEAKQYVDQMLTLTWTNYKGEEIKDNVYVMKVGFVPMYGPCLVTDVGEIRFDRVVAWEEYVAPHRKAA